ncbi:MAG: hypothetical protein P8I93_08430 [Crocinitomicaceae bacterium]|nr:hypothetical protein [Crocinitomicaceae bacterium]
MDKIASFFEKNKYGLLASFSTYMFLFIFLNLLSYKENSSEEYSLENLKKEKEKEKEEDELVIQAENFLITPTKKGDRSKNTTKDLNDKREESKENWSENIPIKLDRENYSVETDDELNQSKQHLKDLQKNIEERNKQKEKTENKKKEGIKNNSEKSFKGSVLVSYDIPNRKSLRLSIPGYSCENAGKIALRVEVDKYGDVTSAKFESNRSTTNDPCMIKLAIDFAKNKSRFKTINSTKKSIGWIYYTFEAQ